MRKRIQQLARGKFQYARPLLSFSADKVDIEVTEGRDYTGDFIITSTNHVPFRGVVYTSDSRMECLTPQFEGEEVRIRYQFHSNGLIEGDIVKGDFFLICNQGEGHRFRSAINIKDAWQSELAFYRTVWGIAIDAPIHVEIANL